jgi:adenosylcobinamide-GDP ribazoletransferase
MLKKEIQYFFAAVQFLTRLPVPSIGHFEQSHLEKSSKYFPLVGLGIGLFNAAFMWLAWRLFDDAAIAVLVAMALGLLLTGAFHEDGFADMCDAFGGGWNKAKILDIMKDSRLGTYGVAGLVMVLLLKFILLQKILLQHSSPNGEWVYFFAKIAAAHATSRLMSVGMIQWLSYVRDEGKSKPLSSQKLTFFELLPALIVVALPTVLMGVKAMLCWLPMLIAMWWMGRWFNKWIGGYTGDCLGAVQQVTEILFYATLILVWKFI